MKPTASVLFFSALSLCTLLRGVAGADDRNVFFEIRANDVDALRKLLAADSGAANATTESGVTPLGYAIVQHRFEAAYELLAAGADVNAATPGALVTPLHRAADRGDADMVRLLLENKADPAAAAANGFTALHFAARTNSQQCVQLLADAGAPIDAADANGRTALHIAAKYDASEAAQALLAAGASTATKDKFGYVPSGLASDPALVAALGGGAGEPAGGAESAGADAAETAEAAAKTDEFYTEDPAEEPAWIPVEKWDDNPFHDESLDPASRVRRFHADPGTTLLPDGRSYWGGLHHGKFEGFGVLLAANERDRYEGKFHRGKKEGLGTFYYENGDVFSGVFEDDAPNGEGEYVFAQGGTVTGTWKRGLLWQGRGTFTVASGAKLAGSWDNGELVASRPID